MTALTDGHIVVGNSSNIATDVAMSGDATIDDTGAVTVTIALDDLTDCITDYPNDNMFLGDSVGSAITTGNFNTGLGAGVFADLADGSRNTAFGDHALESMDSGGGNTAVGSGAYALGTNAGNGGNGNTAIGEGAMAAHTFGNSNTAIGQAAMSSFATGDSNVVIGASSDVLDGVNNAIVIGANCSASASSTCVIGGTDLQSVIIGGGSVGALSSVIFGDLFTLTSTNLSGTNTGDQTITLTGDVTGSGTGSFATSIKSSVALAGSPTTTTQSAADNSTKIATTAYVDAAVSVAAPILTGYMSGCLVANDATTPNTKVDIASGIAASSTGTTYIKSAGYTVDFSSSGAVNKLDTGTIAASTWYYVFVIAKADGTTGGLASLSATAPALPSGYTVSRRVGSVRTDASAHILAFKAAYTGGGTTEQFWTAPVLDVSTTTLGTSSTSFTLTVPPAVACESIIQYFLATGNIIIIRSLDQPDQVPSGTAAPLSTHGSLGAGGNEGMGFMRVRTNTSGQIAMRSDGASTSVKAATLGWVDYRGT